MRLTETKVREVLKTAGFPEADLDAMVKIAWRESVFSTDAKDRHGNVGLFQINMMWWEILVREGVFSAGDDPFDPVINARAAKIIHDRVTELNPTGTGEVWMQGWPHHD